MIIDKNGLKLEANIVGTNLTYKVLDQSVEFTNKLRSLGHVRSGPFSMRSNQKPSFNHADKRFFVRGDDPEFNDKVVKAKFTSAAEARTALAELNKLIEKIDVPEERKKAKQIQLGRAIVSEGGTSCIRFMFINREMARHLSLTGKDHYPDECIEWHPMVPYWDENIHFREHIGQAVDVCNKSIMSAQEYALSNLEDGVINQHKVDPESAKKAVKYLRKSFKDAYEGGFLVAYWRLVTGLRSDDSKY